MSASTTEAVQGKVQRACVAGRPPGEERNRGGRGWCVGYPRRSDWGGEGSRGGGGMGRDKGCCICDVWVGVGGWFGFVRGSAIPGLWVVQWLRKGGCGRVWFGLVGGLGS